MNTGIAGAQASWKPVERRRQIAVLGGLAAGAAMLLAGGCADKVLWIDNDVEFKKILRESDKPVLVDFWKAGCASCAMVEPVMNRLAKDYGDRVVVSRFMMENFFFGVQSWELYKKYEFAFFPTVILFVNGQERKRWVWNTDVNAYRKVLTPLVGPPTSEPDRKASGKSSGPAKPKAVGPAAPKPSAPAAKTGAAPSKRTASPPPKAGGAAATQKDATGAGKSAGK